MDGSIRGAALEIVTSVQERLCSRAVLQSAFCFRLCAQNDGAFDVYLFLGSPDTSNLISTILDEDQIY